MKGEDNCIGGYVQALSLLCYWMGGTHSLAVTFQGHYLAAPFLITIYVLCYIWSQAMKASEKGQLSFLMSHSPM